MDIPDILKIIIFDDFLKIAKKKGPPKDPIGALFNEHVGPNRTRASPGNLGQAQGPVPERSWVSAKMNPCRPWRASFP